MSRQPDPYSDTLNADTLNTPPAVDADGRPVVVEPALAAPVAAVVEPPFATPVAAVASAPVVERVVVDSPAVHQTVATSHARRYAVDSIVVGLVGLAWLATGLIAMTRAGLDGSMKEPVVEVLGFTHTATLGIIEAGIGLCLLLCAAAMTRGGAVFFGLLLGVGGFVGAVQTDSFESSLALESGLAWLAVISGFVVVAVSILLPRMVTRTDRVEAI